ncbi:hypothetical protein KJ562_03295, partial [Patescibacteria group bacterium]|nr:hypothetical protein [Patescibacteria group bacterium]
VFPMLHGKPVRTAVAILGLTITDVQEIQFKERRTKKDVLVLLATITMSGLVNTIALLMEKLAAMDSVLLHVNVAIGILGVIKDALKADAV